MSKFYVYVTEKEHYSLPQGIVKIEIKFCLISFDSNSERGSRGLWSCGHHPQLRRNISHCSLTDNYKDAFTLLDDLASALWPRLAPHLASRNSASYVLSLPPRRQVSDAIRVYRYPSANELPCGLRTVTLEILFLADAAFYIMVGTA